MAFAAAAAEQEIPPRSAAARPPNGSIIAPAAPPALTAPPADASASRLSLSAWTFVRRGDSPSLAAGGMLGGSQAGARLLYRLGGDAARPLSASLRVSAALGHPRAGEVAVGVDWKPARHVPVHFLAERREALGTGGRSAFDLTLYGGVDELAAGPLRIDGYGQAGIVGAKRRDLFADGAVRLSLPVGGRVKLGAGAWGAAQPGVSRIDLGPQASLHLSAGRAGFTLSADWRFRVAGNARPGSGPALTLSAGF